MAKKNLEENETDDPADGQGSEPFPRADSEIGDAKIISAASLVAADTDRPVADTAALRVPEAHESPPADAPAEPAKRGRGRPKGSKTKPAAPVESASRPPPSFDDLNGKAPAAGSPALIAPQVKRNYHLEAASIFIPASSVAAQFFGEHWGVQIDQEKKQIKFTPEQEAYLASMAAWLEFEQFPPMNPRYGFLFATLAYAGPKLQTEPTPTKIKTYAARVSAWWKNTFKK